MPKRVLCDFHHTDLFRAFQFLFEKRLGWELYRPSGREYWEKSYYWHPIEAEGIGNLTPHNVFDPSQHSSVIDGIPQDGTLFRNFGQDGTRFRWLPLEGVKDIDLILCSTDRTQDGFSRLRQDHCPRVPIVRYIGNRDENVNPDTFDILFGATRKYYLEYVKTGRKPGLHYHPEFDTNLYGWKPLPFFPKFWDGQEAYPDNPPRYVRPDRQYPYVPFVRTFLNFIYHHREPGSPWEIFQRYSGYCSEIGAVALMHGLGTPPAGVEIGLDIIMDTWLREHGQGHLCDRNNWPDLLFNRGEPANHSQIARLMQNSNLVIHPKRGSEGYGFLIHQLASMGRPPVVEMDWYNDLSAKCFLEPGVTCLNITGYDPTDKEAFRQALLPENLEPMATKLHKRFKENVNFDDEAFEITKLIR